MALDRAGSSPSRSSSASGTGAYCTPIGVSGAALQRYEEAVFRVTTYGRI
jgi:hypothetical protein